MFIWRYFLLEVYFFKQVFKMCNANPSASQTLCTCRTLQGLKLDLRQTNQVHLPVASPQQIKLILNYALILLLKKNPTGHRPYHNMCYKSSRISCVTKAKCWTWLHFVLWGMEEEGRGYCNKGEKTRVGNHQQKPLPPPSSTSGGRETAPSLSCLEFRCFRQLSRKFTASFF